MPDQPLHVIQRGNNRAPVFFDDDDYRQCRDWLTEIAAEDGCAVHAYVLMTNHVHLLVTPSTAESLPRTMQALGSERFKQQIAKALGRRVTRRSPGRPANERDDKRQINLL